MCHSLLTDSKSILFTKEALKQWERFESSLPNFPVINRDITHQEMLELIEEYRDFANAVRSNSIFLDELSQDKLMDFATETEAEMDRFAIWYNESRKSWEIFKTVRGIVNTAGRIKGYLLEARIAFLLSRSGFTDIRPSITLRDLRETFGNEQSLSEEQKKYLSEREITEIDFIASRNGTHYLIELKSYLPLLNNSRFFTNMKKTRTQMEKRSKFLNILDLNQNWNTVLIFEYTLPPGIMQEYINGVVDISFGLTTFTDYVKDSNRPKEHSNETNTD